MVELMNRRRKAIAEMKAKAKREKPITTAQQKDFMRTFVKNQSSVIYTIGWTWKDAKWCLFFYGKCGGVCGEWCMIEMDEWSGRKRDFTTLVPVDLLPRRVVQRHLPNELPEIVRPMRRMLTERCQGMQPARFPSTQIEFSEILTSVNEATPATGGYMVCRETIITANVTAMAPCNIC
nr:hypothetical protein [Tanacetum cinerariifolium]